MKGAGPRSGLSLIELVLTLSIIGIILGIFTGFWSLYLERSRKIALKTQISNCVACVDRYLFTTLPICPSQSLWAIQRMPEGEWQVVQSSAAKNNPFFSIRVSIAEALLPSEKIPSTSGRVYHITLFDGRDNGYLFDYPLLVPADLVRLQ